MGYIYLRTNLVNGKKYVGQAKNIKVRNNAWNNLKKEYAGYVINNARAKYGADGFSFEILKECPNEDMNYWEIYYIKMYNSKKPYGYNMTDGGDSTYEITEETRKKIGDTLRGRKRPDLSAAHRGKHYPKLSAAKRGKKLSDEVKKKISETHRGKPKSPEHKSKLSAALKTSEKAKIARTKVAAAQRGKPKPKVSAALRGKYNTKISKAVQALDKDGNVVYEFPSTQEAQRQGFSAGNISECCRNCYKRHGNNIYKGYIWRYAV